MAGIYLSRCESEHGRRDFHLGDKPLHEIAGEFGFRPEDREPAMPEYLQPNEPLFVVVAVREEEVEGTKFQAGFYRATIRPHHAMRHCGVGLSDILGGPRSDSE
jgi:hypothetical protein